MGSHHVRARQLVGLLAVLLIVGGAAMLPSRGDGGVERSGAVRQFAIAEPHPLSGVPLRHPTGLRLLVADVPPFVLDVNSGRVTRVREVPTKGLQALWVVGVGGKAAIVVAESARVRRLYSVRGPRTSATFLGTGRNVWPSQDGSTVWVQGRSGRARCTVREIALDGRVVRAPRSFPCATVSDPPGGSLGVVANRTRIVDPLTGSTVFSSPSGIVAVVGDQIVLTGSAQQLTLMDFTTRTENRLEWPSALSGLGEVMVEPEGRFAAIEFADPAYSGGWQALDVWVLDGETGALQELPGMPAFVSLKRTNMAWTSDGRLVLVAESDGRDVVAVWRPGQQRLEVKTVRLPDRSESGSDSFAVLR